LTLVAEATVLVLGVKKGRKAKVEKTKTCGDNEHN